LRGGRTGKLTRRRKKDAQVNIFFAKSTFFHAGKREKKLFFHAEINYFLSRWKLQREKKYLQREKSTSSVKKSTFFFTFFHAEKKSPDKQDLDM
jgi:hypothetical protein